MRRLFLLVALPLLAWSIPLQAAEAWNRVQQTGELRWGADASGGAPYVFPDAADPKKIIGFEVELMEVLAKHMHVRPVLVLVPWEQLVPALERDNFDMAFNGLEVTADRQAVIDFTEPYYYFSEQLTVRRGDTRFRALDDLEGHRVATLSASLAYSMLAHNPKITAVTYPSPVEAYGDLQLGRVDAAFFDQPIAAWYAAPNAHLQNVEPLIGESEYAGGIRKDSPKLKAAVDNAIAEATRSGELEAIYKKWNLWTPNQRKLQTPLTPALSPSKGERGLEGKPWWRFIPLLLQGAGMTILISFLSMALAALGGAALCYGRLYGAPFIRRAAVGYIEIIRGTPLLIQLYLLYYGLPNLGIQLNAFVAAVFGMGMNYAAYEAEIYRAGMLAVPRGQSDAARSLGMTHNQGLWHIILPQAFRTILPPSTNDFIALFKDTSLVSILTVTELTRAYSTAATTTYRFLELGLVTAALYFLMSFPLALWSRSLERKRHAAVH